MRLFRLLPVILGFALTTAAAQAGEGGFIATLSAGEQAAAGLTRLTADEQMALNRLVAREVALARQGSVTAFTGTFVSRRQAADHASAGLDRLTVEEQAKLNGLVAAAIAGAPERRVAAKLRKEDVVPNDRLQIHGSVSVMYGWGSGGREFHGGSLYTSIYDPDTGIALGLGLSQFSGDGWVGNGRSGFGGRPGGCHRRW